ncbi:MAG: putative manganese-dependent inorganic diphosphatase, partial [Spirochaetales bacterium]|nr:putative manganese-dependent inorganic diphosphatase [Candidatus Physcosoma equi]
MKKVFITGHRNPDLDSICSAYGYAVLKNKIDPKNHYQAVRCGHMSDSVKKQVALIGITPPPYVRDVHAKVGDVMHTSFERIEADDPIYNLVKTYNDSNLSAFPVFSGEEFKGLLSVDDITSWFLRDNAEDTPVYPFLRDNIGRVIPGRYITKGEEAFTASLLAGAAAYEEFSSIITQGRPSIIVMGYRKRYIEYAMKKNVPAIIITTTDDTGDIDFSSYKGTVYVTQLGTAEVLRRLRMTPSVSSIMSPMTDSLQVNDLFDDAKELQATTKLRGIPVFDGDKFAGFVTRRCFLKKPSHSVILVDHNEVGQSIRGIENASVEEIIDHHRLDALKTDLPIFIDAEPLGSTCTIVYQQYLRHNMVPDELTAKTLLTGIISDTIILKSPTTTAIDKAAAGALAAICGEYDIHAFGEKLFSVTESLGLREPKPTIASDFKIYKEKGLSIGIGQCETTTLKDVSEYSAKYIAALEETRREGRLDWALLMVTDVLREQSVLFVTDHKLNKKLPYSKLSEGVYD